MFPDDCIQLSPIREEVSEMTKAKGKGKQKSGRGPNSRAQTKRQKEKVRHDAEMAALQDIRTVLSRGEFPMGQEAIMKLGLGDVLKMAIHYIDDLRWYLAYSEAQERSLPCPQQQPVEVNYVSEYGPHAEVECCQKSGSARNSRSRKRKSPSLEYEDQPIKRVCSQPSIASQLPPAASSCAAQLSLHTMDIQFSPAYSSSSSSEASGSSLTASPPPPSFAAADCSFRSQLSGFGDSLHGDDDFLDALDNILQCDPWRAII